MDIPPYWLDIELDQIRGTVMVVGATDSGKSTFSRYLYSRLGSIYGFSSIGFLDGDPGQSTLGPPTTISLLLGKEGEESERLWRYFVGSTTPRGHMLAMLVGVAKLTQQADKSGARTIIYDTSGLIDPSQGGLALKLAKVELLQPSLVIGIQHELELEPLLQPLRLSERVKILSFKPSIEAQRRDFETRRTYRSSQYARYFRNAHSLELSWSQLAVFPLPRFSLRRLVALENSEGFTMALGIVAGINRQIRQVTLFTPLSSLTNVNAIRLGDVAIDRLTFQDTLLS